MQGWGFSLGLAGVRSPSGGRACRRSRLLPRPCSSAAHGHTCQHTHVTNTHTRVNIHQHIHTHVTNAPYKPIPTNTPSQVRSQHTRPAGPASAHTREWCPGERDALRPHPQVAHRHFLRNQAVHRQHTGVQYNWLWASCSATRPPPADRHCAKHRLAPSTLRLLDTSTLPEAIHRWMAIRQHQAMSLGTSRIPGEPRSATRAENMRTPTLTIRAH